MLISVWLAFFVTALVPEPGFVIDGRITGATNGAKVYLRSVDEKICLDSTTILNERFSLKGIVQNPTTCWLECGSEYATIQVENTAMEFESPLTLMRVYHKATGGREQQLQTELSSLQFRYDLQTFTAYDSLTNKKYRTEAERERLSAILNNSQDSAQAIYIAFGKQHPDSWLGLDILYRNRNQINKDSLEKYLSVSGLEFTAKAKAIAEYIYGELAQKGKPFIDFTVQTMEEKSFTLSSLKGKYILLSFWDAGCIPCRRENRKINAEKERFNGKLEFVSFSMDKNKAAWIKASKADKISWHNVSDGMGGTGKIKTLYDVQAMPAAFLINPDGIIIETFTGFEDDFLDRLYSFVK